MTQCNVCGRGLRTPIFESIGNCSLTSLCELRPGPTRVFYCRECGHLMTEELEDVAEFYDVSYRILLDSEDEDQLYKSIDGRKVYRTEHQINCLMKSVTLERGARVLDYGSAKGAVMKRLLRQRPDIDGNLFDVSEMYVEYWERFRHPDHWATYKPKPQWENSFDVVTSFFVMEHIPDLAQTAAEIHRLLKRGGVFYFTIPNVYANPADFLVVDHVNHFSEESLRRWLTESGFTDVQISDTMHDSAWVVSARKSNPNHDARHTSHREQIASLQEVVVQLGNYWRQAYVAIRRFEEAHHKMQAAIYGSGFYGSFVAANLKDLEPVTCFLDANPYRQGQVLMDRPVMDPLDLESSPRVVYVGLNPRVARSAINAISEWRGRPYAYFYLQDLSNDSGQKKAYAA